MSHIAYGFFDTAASVIPRQTASVYFLHFRTDYRQQEKRGDFLKLHHKPCELCWFFLLGAFVYSLLEIVCRGYTHWTMTLTGGAAAVGLYLIHAAAPPRTLLLQYGCGAILITALEFTVGVADNLVMGWNVWDYSSMPLNLYGQICLPFTGLWFLLCIPAFSICRIAEKRFHPVS